MYEAISQMERNKAPRSDGFPAEFYKTFWEVIRDDLMALSRSVETREFSFVYIKLWSYYFASLKGKCGSDSTI